MKRSLPVLLLTTLWMGCSRSPHAGFTEVNDDVHIQLHWLGDGQTTASDSDSVRVRMRVSLLGDPPGSLFSTERVYGARNLRRDALVEAMDRLHAGDSMSIICPAERMPWKAIGLNHDATVPEGREVRTEFTLLDILTPARMRAERERQRVSDPAGFERRLIATWLRDNGAGFLRWGTSDIYYHLEGLALDTLAVRRGELVTVVYAGTRLEDGMVVDDTKRHGGTFTWRYGDPDQVIGGLEVAVSLLRVGRSGDFILPSAYAFGERGVPGLVDPYSPMLYRVGWTHVDRTPLP